MVVVHTNKVKETQWKHPLTGNNTQYTLETVNIDDNLSKNYFSNTKKNSKFI